MSNTIETRKDVMDKWCGNIVDSGEFVSDGILLFKKQDARPRLLKRLLDKSGISKGTRPLKIQKSCRELWQLNRKMATHKLYFIKKERSTSREKVILFVDTKKRPTHIDERYFLMARILLGFDGLKARKGTGENLDPVVLYKGRKAVGVLMPVCTGEDSIYVTDY